MNSDCLSSTAKVMVSMFEFSFEASGLAIVLAVADYLATHSGVIWASFLPQPILFMFEISLSIPNN